MTTCTRINARSDHVVVAGAEERDKDMAGDAVSPVYNVEDVEKILPRDAATGTVLSHPRQLRAHRPGLCETSANAHTKNTRFSNMMDGNTTGYMWII